LMRRENTQLPHETRALDLPNISMKRRQCTRS
jgi:hypothetical protein